jgi:D-alanine-D-alanine ligase
MNIVVLAGGLSPERNVSLSSGTLICRALRKMGHRAVLLDPFLGLEPDLTVSEALFDREALCPMSDQVGVESPDLDQIRASVRTAGAFFRARRVGAVPYCRFVFIGLHGGAGKTADAAALDLLEFLTPGGLFGSASPWTRTLQKRVAPRTGCERPTGSSFIR